MTKPLLACEWKEKSHDWERRDGGDVQQAGGGDNVRREEVGGGGDG